MLVFHFKFTEITLSSGRWSTQASDLDLDWNVHWRASSERRSAFYHQRENKGHQKFIYLQPQQPTMESQANY